MNELGERDTGNNGASCRSRDGRTFVASVMYVQSDSAESGDGKTTAESTAESYEA